MNKLIFLLAPAAFTTTVLQAQQPEPSWGIRFSGFVKHDMFYDTRQTTAANGLREGHFYLFPDDVLDDLQGNDVNANPAFHMLGIQTRLKGDITGPDAFGAKTSGLIEAEFFGTSEADLNGFRLRHAYVKLDWKSTSVLSGQFWHPMFPAESFPGTLSFNTGAPFTPFSRNPQVRITQKLGPASLTLAAYSQRDFTSPGPDGNSNKYLRNTGVPGIHFQVKVQGGEIITAWAGIDYKKLRPELRSVLNNETDEAIGGISAFANLKIKTAPLNIMLMGILGRNAADLMMLGGYAVSSVYGPLDQFREYTTINSSTMWADISTNGKTVSFGVFSGFSKNMGSKEDIAGTVYARGNNIDHLFRISPRVALTQGRFTFGTELESTTSAYGTMQSDGRVTNTHNVTNLRVLLCTIFRF
jgi:hypothetical protein